MTFYFYRHDNCLINYLEVFDGIEMSSKSFGKFCSSENHPVTLTTTSNHALIKMKTDVSMSSRGFLLRYLTNCNRTIYMDSGVIESPNFPEKYSHNVDCSWTIVVSKGNKINIQFTDFDLTNQNSLKNESNVRISQNMI